MLSKFFPLGFPQEWKCYFPLSPSQRKLCTPLCNQTISKGLGEARLGQAVEKHYNGKTEQCYHGQITQTPTLLGSGMGTEWNLGLP